MVKIDIYMDSHDNICKYVVRGHAGYGEYGSDIVCSAVSVLAQTTIISIVENCGVDEKSIDYTIDDGYLEFNLPKSIDEIKLEKSQIVLKTFEVGIKSIIESYPKHISLRYREV